MIVCHYLENGQTMKVNAYAGTGKTTTLIAYAAKRMDESFLYIAYNKFVGIFLRNCSTSDLDRFKLMQKKSFHRMSNAKQFIRLPMQKSGRDRLIESKMMTIRIFFSRQYDGRLGNLRLKSIVDIIHDRAPIGEKGRTINSLYLRARFVYNTLNHYLSSADSQITDEHVGNGSSSNETNGPLVLTAQEKIVKFLR